MVQGQRHGDVCVENVGRTPGFVNANRVGAVANRQGAQGSRALAAIPRSCLGDRQSGEIRAYFVWTGTARRRLHHTQEKTASAGRFREGDISTLAIQIQTVGLLWVGPTTHCTFRVPGDGPHS
jgi:hypothetical protein